MNLCSHGHEEVVHEGRICPVCEKQDELDKASEEINNLNRRIQELEEDKE